METMLNIKVVCCFFLNIVNYSFLCSINDGAIILNTAQHCRTLAPLLTPCA